MKIAVICREELKSLVAKEREIKAQEIHSLQELYQQRILDLKSAHEIESRKMEERFLNEQCEIRRGHDAELHRIKSNQDDERSQWTAFVQQERERCRKACQEQLESVAHRTSELERCCLEGRQECEAFMKRYLCLEISVKEKGLHFEKLFDGLTQQVVQNREVGPP